MRTRVVTARRRALRRRNRSRPSPAHQEGHVHRVRLDLPRDGHRRPPVRHEQHGREARSVCWVCDVCPRGFELKADRFKGVHPSGFTRSICDDALASGKGSGRGSASGTRSPARRPVWCPSVRSSVGNRAPGRRGASPGTMRYVVALKEDFVQRIISPRTGELLLSRSGPRSRARLLARLPRGAQRTAGPPRRIRSAPVSEGSLSART
jgi:hypothetical protein